MTAFDVDRAIKLAQGMFLSILHRPAGCCASTIFLKSKISMVESNIARIDSDPDTTSTPSDSRIRFMTSCNAWSKELASVMLVSSLSTATGQAVPSAGISSAASVRRTAANAKIASARPC
eukprot:TRINITY_DN12086_c0_g1_i11.p4 TRINITY_DN12086_c0_g1~~TRINITY_DN12086_c0_g1_i11.p4  ORF type:complete len:120 (+),score=10.13 TRINITY_DN12086_c0_g1_i11:2911-3270(+)